MASQVTGPGIALRYRGRLHHIGVGAPYKHWRVILLVAGRDIRVLTLDGTQLQTGNSMGRFCLRTTTSRCDGR